MRARHSQFTTLPLVLLCLLAATAHADRLACLRGKVQAAFATPNPADVTLIRDLPLHPFDIEVIKKIDKKIPAYYLKDEAGNTFVIDQKIPFSKKTGILFVESEGDVQGRLRISEFGRIMPGPKNGPAYELRPRARLEVPPLGKPEDALSSYRSGQKTRKFEEYLDCASILKTAGSPMKDAVYHFLGNNLTMIGVELAFNPLATPEDKRRMTADLVGGNVNGIIGNILGTKVAEKGFRAYATSFLPAGMMFTSIQNGVNKTFDIEKKENTGGNLVSYYNYAHRLVLFYPNYVMNDLLKEKLPDLIYERCRKGQPIGFFMRPGTLRIAERVGQSILYFAPREALLSVTDKR